MSSITRLENRVARIPADETLTEALKDLVHNGRARIDGPDIGKLSAAALQGEFEAAAKQIEQMAAEMLDAAKRCEAMVASVHEVAAYITATALHYRQEGQRHFEAIERNARLAEDVRRLCDDLNRRILAGEPAARPAASTQAAEAETA